MTAESGHPALRRCVGVEIDLLAQRYWGRRPLLSRAAQLPKTFDDLLTLAGVDELLSGRGLRTPFLRLARDGTVVSSAQFTGGGGVGAQVGDQILDDRVLRLFAEGCTVVLQGLHRTWRPLTDLARQLGAELGHPVQVNAYVTPPSSQGFAAHYDVHDVFVLQIAGRKRWRVHEPVHPEPLRNQPWQEHAGAVADRATEPAVLDEVLTAGDALYLPRGYLHSARALGEVAAHLTVGVHVLTRYDLVEAVCALAVDDVRLRQTLPLGIDVTDPAQLEGHLAATVEALVGALRAAEPAEVARSLRDRVWAGSRPAPIAPLAQARAAELLEPGDLVRPRESLRCHLRAAAERVLLDLPHGTVELPVGSGPAMAVLLAGEPVRVGELPGLSSGAQVALVRRLLVEGVLVPGGPPGMGP